MPDDSVTWEAWDLAVELRDPTVITGDVLRTVDAELDDLRRRPTPKPPDRTAWLEEFWRAMHALWEAQKQAGRLPLGKGPTPERIAADKRVAEAMKCVEIADDVLHGRKGD